MNCRLNNERGSAFLITLALIIMVSAVGLMSLTTSMTNVNTAFSQVRKDMSLRIAEAGLERSLSNLNADSAWRTGFANVSLGDGAYWVAVLDSSSALTSGDTVILRSTGVVREASAVLELWVVPEPYRPFKYALFAKNNIDMQDTACTDSYNSDSGTYAATRLDAYGDVGSNGQVRLTESTTIGGNVAATRSSDLSVDSSVTVFGEVISNLSPQKLDLVPASEFAWAKSQNRAPAGLSGSGYTYNAVTGVLTVNANSTVTLAAGAYRFSKVQISTNGQFLIAPGAKASVYVSGDVEIAQHGAMNPGGAPSALTLFSQGSTFQMDDYSEFRGAVIGPDMQLQLQETVQAYGAMLMGQVDMRNNACFHHDRSLMDWANWWTGRYERVAWREL